MASKLSKVSNFSYFTQEIINIQPPCPENYVLVLTVFNAKIKEFPKKYICSKWIVSVSVLLYIILLYREGVVPFQFRERLNNRAAIMALPIMNQQCAIYLPSSKNNLKYAYIYHDLVMISNTRFRVVRSAESSLFGSARLQINYLKLLRNSNWTDRMLFNVSKLTKYFIFMYSALFLYKTLSHISHFN